MGLGLVIVLRHNRVQNLIDMEVPELLLQYSARDIASYIGGLASLVYVSSSRHLPLADSMRLPSYLITFSALSAAAIASPLAKRAAPQGIDVSNHQGTIDWTKVASEGLSFVYIKATEGTCTA